MGRPKLRGRRILISKSDVVQIYREGGVECGRPKETRMAESTLFVCNACRKAVESWSDGNPYYIDEAGAKRYAYHPDHERLARCVGNDSPHLCPACGVEFKVDSRAPIDACPGCGASEIVDTASVDVVSAPKMNGGHGAMDP
jgi:predicted RNA-binding Zn-ribbon protein involved in translation (DUF1610 family)